jgi:hypothetical protein
MAMSTEATAGAPASSGEQAADGGRVAGLLKVGDYVGQPAAAAAQAVRRTGLRPGLERSYGCSLDEQGLIVAQDPACGSDLARGSMVSLYVAAPGPAADTEGDLDGGQAAPAGPGVQAAEAGGQARTAPAPGSPARRRKSRPASAGQRELFQPSADAKPQAGGDALLHERRQPAEPPAAEPEEPQDTPGDRRWPLDSAGTAGAEELEPFDEARLTQTEELFARRTGRAPGWRRARVPGGRRRMTRAARGHPVLAGVTSAALATWICVAGVTAFASPSGRAAAGSGHSVRAASRPPRRAASANTPAAGAPRRHARPEPRREMTRRHPAAMPAARRATPPPTQEPAVQGAPPPEARPPPSASEPPQSAGAPQQSGGGPFSP